MRCRAAASLFSFFLLDGLAKYRFSLSVFSMPSLSMRFLNLDSTRSVGSPGLTLIVNIYPLLYLCIAVITYFVDTPLYHTVKSLSTASVCSSVGCGAGIGIFWGGVDVRGW